MKELGHVYQRPDDTNEMLLSRTISARSLRALDSLNVFLADVRDGVGPYLAIYLLATHHWNPASIGIAMSAMGMATVLAQTPAGWLIDTLKQKRLLIVIAALLVGISCAAITVVPTLPFIIAAQALNGMAVAIFPPAVAAITLGLVGPRRFAARMGRNEAFNHGGNVAAAALAGLAGYYLGREWIFWSPRSPWPAPCPSCSFGSRKSITDLREPRHLVPHQTKKRAGVSSRCWPVRNS
jgi:MFS family permease